MKSSNQRKNGLKNGLFLTFIVRYYQRIFFFQFTWYFSLNVYSREDLVFEKKKLKKVYFECCRCQCFSMLATVTSEQLFKPSFFLALRKAVFGRTLNKKDSVSIHVRCLSIYCIYMLFSTLPQCCLTYELNLKFCVCAHVYGRSFFHFQPPFHYN